MKINEKNYENICPLTKDGNCLGKNCVSYQINKAFKVGYYDEKTKKLFSGLRKYHIVKEIILIYHTCHVFNGLIHSHEEVRDVDKHTTELSDTPWYLPIEDYIQSSTQTANKGVEE